MSGEYSRRHVARRPAHEGGRRAVGLVGVAPTRRQDVDKDVMDDLAVARTALGRLHPDVLLEAGVHDEPLIVQHAGGRHLELFGHREDLVRLADLPALDELHGRRQVLVVSLLGALVDPRQQRVALVLRSGAGRWRTGRSAGRRARGASALRGPLRGFGWSASRRLHRSATRTDRSRPADGIPDSVSG